MAFISSSVVSVRHAAPASSFCRLPTSLQPHARPRARPRAALGAARLPPPLQMTSPEPQNSPTPKDVAALYGGSYLATSIGLSIISFLSFYALVYVGVDVRALTTSFGNWLATTPLGRPAALDNIPDAASAAAIAYIAHKVTSPLRFPITVAATPFIAKLLSSKASDDLGE